MRTIASTAGLTALTLSGWTTGRSRLGPRRGVELHRVGPAIETEDLGIAAGQRPIDPRAARELDPGLAPRLVAAIRDRGVITRLLRGVALQISPPFVITEAEIDRIAEVFAAALDAVAAGPAR